MRVAPVVVVVVGLAVWLVGCGGPPVAPARDADNALKGPHHAEYALPGFEDRNYILRLPPGYDGGAPVPIVLLLHGGGGNKVNAFKTTCPDGDDNNEGCIAAVADREGFAVVSPDGTFADPLISGVRTWNAGGGVGDLQCVSGAACEKKVDDIAFFDALLAELERAINVDTNRIYATGISNGAAMAHRLACERSTRIAAIAPVAGGNQFAAAGECNTTRPVPVLEMHGSADPCWALEGGADACLQSDGKLKVDIITTVDGWAERNGCIGAVTTESVGSSTTRSISTECLAGGAVEFLLTDGAGHTWPGGHQYASENEIGSVTRDYNANDEMMRFFGVHTLSLQSE
jgi:polyhydroxybutyrate depolymerase